MRVLTRILRQLKRSRAFGVAAVAALVAVSPAMAVESVEWNGFALIRPETPTKGAPFDDDSLNAQVQVGLDWRPSPAFGAHVHLLARNDDDVRSAADLSHHDR